MSTVIVVAIATTVAIAIATATAIVLLLLLLLLLPMLLPLRPLCELIYWFKKGSWTLSIIFVD